MAKRGTGWIRPRNIVLALLVAALACAGWCLTEVLRLSSQRPSATFDARATLDEAALRAAGADPDRARAAWARFETVLDQLETQVTAIRSQREAAGSTASAAGLDLADTLTAEATLDSALPVRRTIERLRADGVFEAMAEFAEQAPGIPAPKARGPLLHRIEPPLEGDTLRLAVETLLARMRISAWRGNQDDVIECIDQLLAMGRTVAFRPFGRSATLARAIETAALDELRYQLHEHEFTAPSCRRLAALLDVHRMPPDAYVVETERIAATDVVQWTYTEPDDGDGYLYARPRGTRLADPSFLQLLDARFFTATRAETTDALERAFAAWTAHAEAPCSGRPVASPVPRPTEGRMWLIDALVPDLAPAFEASCRAARCNAAVRLLLALESFRAERGSEPETLGELVPAHIAAIPDDPVSGAPFEYRRTEDDPHGRAFVLSAPDAAADREGWVANAPRP